MKFEKFVKSLASSGVIYKRGVDDLPFADRWLASPSVFMLIPPTVRSVTAEAIQDNPIDDEIKALCEDVLTRWYAEKAGETDVGRVLPSDYMWFTGDGEHNYFRNAYEGGKTWDWSLQSPYKS